MSLIILLCFLAQMATQQTVDIQCECVHISEEESCRNSAKCRWIEQEQKCIQGTEFSTQTIITTYCAQFAEEECVQDKKCAFYLGKCKDFVNCGVFMKEKCDQSSIQCISDGYKCISKGLCSDYLTQIACQKLNLLGKYCKWRKQDDQYFCEDIQECKDLPDHLMVNSDCRKQIEICTISLKGGCEIAQKFCNQYKQKEQCYFNYDQIECFWDDNLNICLDKICKNIRSSNFEVCQKIDRNCTTNGQSCIARLDCDQYQNLNSCVEDYRGNKCIYYKEKCLQKNCISAPNLINSMIECQAFQYKDIPCVPKKMGGCQMIPQQCEELVTEDSCNSIKELDGKQCFWQDQQKVCKIKQCSDAPLQYNHIECIGWLDDYICIGGINNGCIENVDDCTKIQNLKSCIKDKVNRKCTIENGQCVEEKCQNLQFPFYDTIFACENRLNICTFSVYSKICINKECSQLEDRQCNFDYDMNKCIQLPGCIHKICESASVYYGTHDECESWDIRCTIHIGVMNGIPYRNGCIKKYLECTDFQYQTQCVNTLQGIPCFWNYLNNQCQFRNCQNAPLSLQTLEECQKWVEFNNIKCLNKENGGCIQQAANCQDLSDKVQCLIGSQQGLCFWNNTIKSCEDRTCENAQNITSNESCRQWLSSCFFTTPNKCIVSISNESLCREFPKNINFTSHEECQTWNPNCTLKFGAACFSEDLCSDYKIQTECQFQQKQINCQWNSIYCYAKACSSSGGLTTDDQCKQYSPSCTHMEYSSDNEDGTSSTIHYCTERQSKCSQIYTQIQCNNHSVTEKCNWISNKCEAKPCTTTDNGQTENSCKNRQYNCIQNSQTLNCEVLQDYCSNVSTISYQGCQNSNNQCILNEFSNQCDFIQHCSDTTTYYSYDCPNISQYCQSKNFTTGCQNLAINCSDYLMQQNCKININRQKCYWSPSQSKCIVLSCSQIEESLTTHDECQQMFSDCTLNLDTNIHSSCMNLLQCSQYQQQQQCFLDNNKQFCSWANNECVLDNSKAAPNGIYTLEGCQQQFGIKYTINENRSKCIIKYQNCLQYNKFQCLTPNQTNFDQVQCFWDQSSHDCKEVLCHKANQLTKELIECEQFNQNCQTKVCKKSICNDYKYDLDINCSIALKNHKCTTDGIQCVERGLCLDAINKAGCTFSINYQDCIWLEDENHCVDKTCSSALNSMNTHQQCQEYLEQCTNKIGGGCVIITTCYSISSPEACLYDKNKEKCIWDEYHKKCIYIQCQSFCGDGVVGKEEQCDDGNILPYDGCYKCRFQCQYGCNNCIKKNCQECNQGFELNQNGQCQEICGDGLIVGQEECDDMNNIQKDGCYQCRFQCHQECLDCIFGMCNKCTYGWEEYNTLCRSVCGNGLLVEPLEQCDDGNIDNNDGCNSDCQIEKDWLCISSQTTQISECKYSQHPQIILENLSQKKDSSQIIKLKFNQQVQLKSDLRFEDFIKINVTNNVDFQFVIQPIKEASLSLQYVEYTFHITLLEKVDYPQVSIQFIQSIFINQQQQELTKLMDTISLGTPLILSLEQQSRLNNTIAFNQIMIYVFIGSSSLSVLMGNLDLFFNMLTLLQQLSYVRQLSVPFPSHLDSYLKVFKVVSFQPLYDQIQIDNIFQKLNFGKVPFMKSKNNEKQDSEFNNSFFLVNAKSFYLTMFLSIFCYLLARLIIKFNSLSYIILMKIQRYKQLYVLNKIFKSIKLFAFKYSNYFIYSGLIKVFISSEYQLMYSAYSQFPEYKFQFDIENLFETFNSFNALFCIIIPHLFLFKSVVILSKQYNSEIVNQYSIFYENIKSDYWSRFFIPFSMIKVTLYMAIICFLFNSAIIQSISLIILCNSFCYYLIAVQPLTQKIELFRLLIREITFLSIITTIFPYCLNFNDDIINILGWIHIGLFSFIIGSNIVLDSVKQILDLRLAYSKNQIKIKQTQQRAYIINGLQQFINVNSTQQNILTKSLSIGYEVQSNQQSQILSLR